MKRVELEALQRAFTDYLFEERGLAEATIRSYEADLRSFARYALATGTTTPLLEVDPATLGRYLARERARGLSESTLRRRLLTLRTWLTFLELEGRPAAPARLVPLLSRRPGLPRALSAPVIDELLRALRERVSRAARRDELRALRALVLLLLNARHGLSFTRLASLPADIDGLPAEHPLRADDELHRAWAELRRRRPGVHPLARDGGEPPDAGALSRLCRRFADADAARRVCHLSAPFDAAAPTGSGGLDAPGYRSALRDLALVELLYAAGPRIAEALGLRWEALDLATGGVRLHGKGGRQRMAPLGETARDALRRLKVVSGGGPEDWVFANRRGEPLTRQAVNAMLRGLSRQLGLEPAVTPHQFRHSFATHLLAGGAGIRLVNELLGHRRLSETQVYTRVEVSRLVEAHGLHPRNSGQD